MMWRKLVVVLGVLGGLALAGSAAARPGSGEQFGSGSSGSGSSFGSSGSGSSYSGSTDYSGSSGGGGGGGLVEILIGMVVLALTVAVKATQNALTKDDWSSSAHNLYIAPPRRSRAGVPAPPNPRRHLAKLLGDADPEFSLVVFDDFLYSLFAGFHEARGGGRRHDVAPYVDLEAKAFLAAHRADDVRAVVVGSMAITNARQTETSFAAEITFEANYEEVTGGEARALYSEERWVLQRDLRARSRSPEHATIDECPNCGGALEAMDGNVCSFCKEALTPGRFDWVVTHIGVERKTRGPMLTSSAPEIGNNLPTVTIRGARERFAEFVAKDTKFSWPRFQQRVVLVFEALHQGWNARDWVPVRPYVSDQLFQSQLYWIEEYKRQKLNNRTDGARIVDVVMSNVESDRHFDAITVRVFATGKDYTVSDDGRLITGSKSVDRQYTEYWTLIRGRAASGAVHGDASCPNCGAATTVNMAGECEHCRVKVTRGDFDWVLSRIEQDEAYR